MKGNTFAVNFVEVSGGLKKDVGMMSYIIGGRGGIEIISKYLADIGVTYDDFPGNIEVDDFTERFLKQQRDEYGFDERETWDLRKVIALFVYPRLRMFDEVNCIDTCAERFEYNGRDYTLQQGLDIVIEGLELYISKKDIINEEEINKIKEAMGIFGALWMYLWW
ncbi:MAG TPA: hypothetical protein DGK91_14220 [Clostridium sp.]|nr:hypothetical protein [Clostridium sp.]